MKEVSAYKVGERVFPTIEEAQIQELTELLSEGGMLNDAAMSVLKRVVDHVDEVIAILTCQPKPKAPRKPRKDRGTKRKPKDNNTPPLVTA